LLDEVFEKFVSTARIFRDREVLRHDYLPEKLPHREAQIKTLGETVAPVLKGARCSNVFIYGKTGTGKTAVTKYVLQHLEVKAKELGAPVKFCYVNCRLAGTEYRVFSVLCRNIGISVPFTGLSVGEVFNRFKNGLDVSKKLLIIVLDEIDALIKARGDTLLYELTRINETLRNSKVSLIGISNDLRLKEFLDPRVLSSLSEEEIVFRPYDASELKNILSERAKLAFQEGALSDGVSALRWLPRNMEMLGELLTCCVWLAKLLNGKAPALLLRRIFVRLKNTLNIIVLQRLCKTSPCTRSLLS